MYTITPDSPRLVPLDENCVTITWPPGVPAPEAVIIVSDVGSREVTLRPAQRETATNSQRICFDVPPGTTAITIRVSGPGGAQASRTLI